MKYVNNFMNSYRVIMEEKARHTEFLRKIQVEKILQQYNERLLKIEKKLKINQKASSIKID